MTTRVQEILGDIGETMSVSRVFGEPYEKNGVTVIPAAAIRGGGGGGQGDDTESQPGGSGGGFGVIARPVGAYRIKGDEVTWIPAADVTRVIVLSELLGIVALLVVRSILRRRRK